jgi:hypothetical protein
LRWLAGAESFNNTPSILRKKRTADEAATPALAHAAASQASTRLSDPSVIGPRVVARVPPTPTTAEAARLATVETRLELPPHVSAEEAIDRQVC